MSASRIDGDAGDKRAASDTAWEVALLRAAHLVIDADPPILDDRIIARLLGPDAESRIRAHAEQLQSPLARGLRSHVLLRSRFTEDSLEAATVRPDPVEQLVILGAGLDTFAYRQPVWAGALTIVEVDHPASQAAKREALARADIAIPSNVRFTDVDFERETLATGLARGGVSNTRRTFFAWLGVTMYLTRDAIDSVLRTVASFPRGSTLVSTFAQPNPSDDAARRTITDRAAAVGEPWLSYFTPDEMETTLRGAGFSAVSFLGRDEAMDRYYTSRRDGLVAPRRVSIATATV